MVNYKIEYKPINTEENMLWKENVIVTAASFLGPLIVPPLHILIVYYFWCDNNRIINKNLCSCSCWDSIFKGPYESGHASYKHVYFNSTSNTFKIWTLTVVCVLLLYEAVRRLASLAVKKRLRYSMALLFISSMFAHYYSWWMFFNYWNDEYYSQWSHQLFFSLTELASSACVLLLADRSRVFSAASGLGIAAVAVVHILASAWDQFIINVLRGEGYSYQVVRDLGFMVPDVLHVAVPVWHLRTERSKHSCVERRHCIAFCSIVVTGICILYIL